MAFVQAKHLVVLGVLALQTSCAPDTGTSDAQSSARGSRSLQTFAQVASASGYDASRGCFRAELTDRECLSRTSNLAGIHDRIKMPEEEVCVDPTRGIRPRLLRDWQMAIVDTNGEAICYKRFPQHENQWLSIANQLRRPYVTAEVGTKVKVAATSTPDAYAGPAGSPCSLPSGVRVGLHRGSNRPTDPNLRYGELTKLPRLEAGHLVYDVADAPRVQAYDASRSSPVGDPCSLPSGKTKLYLFHGHVGF